jgi:radical SAM superfamily enzyme YgiQ (UPF0313 family)
MRIGLIAMSGVRAEDPELTRLGLTLPGFVDRNRIVASLPSLGLLTVAGMTPDDVDLEYIEIQDIAKVEHLPNAFDAVAISTYTAQSKQAYALAKQYRAKGTPVIMGGLHVCLMPEEAKKHVDCIVIGEGELAWPTLIADLKVGGLKSVYDVRDQEFDLADAPMPRFDLLEPERYNRLTVQTQRGCPFHCEFCASSIWLSSRYKLKPVEKVIAEIRQIKEIWPNPFIEFADDNTFVNKAHGKKLVEALIPENVRWFSETDVSIAEDDELLKLMRKSRCAQVLIGFESPNEARLHGLELKANWKAKQAHKYRDAIAKIQDQGISVIGCFIIGLDGTEPQDFDAILDFVHESGLYDVQITVATPFPGTPFYDRLLNEGRILREDASEYCTLFDLNFRPQNMSVEELEDGYRKLGQIIYSEEETALRRQNFKRRLRNVIRRERMASRHDG